MPSPRSAPAPLSRWSEGWRIGVAIVLGFVLWTIAITEDIPEDSLLPLLDLVLGIAAIVAMHWRRRWPLAIALATALATAGSALALVASMIAFVSLVTTRRWRAVTIVGALGSGASIGYERVTGVTDDWPWWATVLGSLVIYGIAVLIGLYVGARRELVTSRAEAVEREQAVRIEQARLAERARIAREMHDVLAHRISLLSLHAGAMTFRSDLSPDELRASALVVQANAQQASLDLRDVLGVLRDPQLAERGAPTAPPERPQPTLADLPALVEEARHAGMAIELSSDLLDGQTPADTAGRTAYRIIQEALTNARKHAPGAPVSLRLTGRPGGRLDIDVSNPMWLPALAAAAGAAGAVPGSGLGLVGLAERATLAGGDLKHGWMITERSDFQPPRGAGPQLAGRAYRVHAWLPWPA